MNPAPAKAPFVLPNTAKRDAIIAILIGLVVFAFIGYGVIRMAAPEKGNELSGTVIEKIFTPQKERQITFDGRKLEGAKEIAGEYVLRVRVESEKRTYDVPVEQTVYEGKNLGDSLAFMRPPSEQQ